MGLLKLGFIGLDTSHAKLFGHMLNDPRHEHYLGGNARVTVGYPGGSADFPASASRVDGYTGELRDKLGVRIAAAVEEVAEEADALLITSVDGRVHPEQFRKVAPFGKPVFIDKPLAVGSREAGLIAETAGRFGVRWMSASVRRYAKALSPPSSTDLGAVTGAECYGPIEFVPVMPGWYWYGIHIAEVLYSILGKGCECVRTVSDPFGESIIGTWDDGRTGIARGNFFPNLSHGAVVHREKGTEYADTGADGTYKYASLLRSVIRFFESGEAEIDPEETLELIRFLEAADESKKTGGRIRLRQGP